MKNWIKKFGGWLPLLIVFVSVFQKAYYIRSFASSGDDNLVASSILYGKMPFNEYKIRATINDKAKPTYYSIPKKLARKIDSTGYLMPIMRKLHFLFPLYAVPNETTYAPLQFFLTAFMVRDTQSMFTNIVMGRLPSLLVHFLGLLLFLYLMVKYFNGGDNPVALCFSLCIISFSYENVLYSIQMESYAIGVTGLLFLIIFYIDYIQDKLLNEKSSYVIVGLMSALLMMMQYQLLFFSFAAVCAIAFYSAFKRVRFSVFAKRMIFSGLVFLIFFIPIFILFLSKHTDHVAVHLIGDTQAIKYWFPGYQINNFKDGFIYTARFFIVNFFEVFRYMTMTFIAQSSIELTIFSINLFLFFIGVIYLTFFPKKERHRIFSIFMFFSVIVWIIVIVLGKIALTPDRHSLIFLPIFVIYLYFGLVVVESFVRKYLFNTKFIQLLLIVLFSLMFFNSANLFLRNRREPFLIADFNENTVPDNSLIISRDRIVYLYSKYKNYTPIFLQTDDESRKGWLVPPNEKVLLPKRIYFIMKYEHFYILKDKDQQSGLLNNLNIVKKFISMLPTEISNEYKLFNDVFLNSGYNQISDNIYTVGDDEIHEKFLRERNTRIVIFDRK